VANRPLESFVRRIPLGSRILLTVVFYAVAVGALAFAGWRMVELVINYRVGTAELQNRAEDISDLAKKTARFQAVVQSHLDQADERKLSDVDALSTALLDHINALQTSDEHVRQDRDKLRTATEQFYRVFGHIRITNTKLQNTYADISKNSAIITGLMRILARPIDDASTVSSQALAGAVQRTNEALGRVLVGLNAYYFSADPYKAQQVQTELRTMEKTVPVMRLLTTSPLLLSAIEAIQLNAEALIEKVNSLDGLFVFRDNLSKVDLDQSQTAMSKAIDALILLTRDTQKQSAARLEKEMRDTLTIILVMTVVLLLLGFWANAIIIASIRRPILELQGVMEDLSGGNWDREVIGADDGDEVAAMATTLDVFKNNTLRMHALEKEKRQDLAKEKEQAEEKYRGIFEHAVEGIFQSSPQGQLLTANPALAEMLGYDSTDEVCAEGLNIGKMFYAKPADRSRLVSALKKNGTVVNFEVDLKRKNGDVYAGLINAKMITQEGSGDWILEGTIQDVTVKREKEKAIGDKIAAQAASVAKTRFLATASHDLRQPLQALNLFLSVLSDRDHDETSQEIINRIAQSTQALGELLNVLLDISKLEAGLIVPDLQQLSMGPLLNRLVDEFKDTAEQKGIEFRAVASQAVVISDPVLLENILRNLLTNAVRYTQQGKILLGCRNTENSLRIEVWDTGIGIEEKYQDQIFEEFFQVGNPSRDRQKGLGLGLSIVSKTVDLLGHRIEVRSVEGQGTVFTLEVSKSDQVIVDVKNDMPKPMLKLVKKPFVIVIDDNVDVLDSLKVLLESWDCRVVAVPCIQQSKQGKCESCQSCDELFGSETPAPELIIADYNLQDGLTGTEAVRVLREHFIAEIPAMLLTGDIKPASLTKIEKSGLPMLHKPINGQRLHEVVHEMLASRSAASDLS